MEHYDSILCDMLNELNNKITFDMYNLDMSTKEKNDEVQKVINKRKLINLLRKCYITCKFDSAEWVNPDENYVCDDIILNAPGVIYNELEENFDILKSIFESISVTEYGANPQILRINKFYKRNSNLEWSQDIVMEESMRQRNRIILELELAQRDIWLSIPTLSDDAIINKLMSKALEGVAVRIIVDDNEYNKIPEGNYFSVYNYKRFGNRGENIMHRKFCLIDFDTLIYGGRNFSKSANYNFEGMHVDIGNETNVNKYTDMFKEEVRNTLLLMQSHYTS